MVTAIAPPAPPTALVGRAAELAALVETVSAAGTRLVTVTGPPGVGKTRLALAAAQELGGRFPGETAWVDLAPVRAARLVLAEIARAVGVDRAPGEAPVARIAQAVSGRDVLVVLDNCEHLLAAVPEIGSLLRSCPRLHVIATSRERLQLAAEREFVLATLPMPSDVEVGDLARLRVNPAVALLLERAPAHVTLTARSARALADVCVRLDGLPLAIELAAARLRVFTPSELAFRLDHRMSVLTGGARDGPHRHRDLRGAISWSHDLLPEAERVVFRRLSVFVGDWTVAAAEAVCDDANVIDAVESLLDKSLIRRVAADQGGARFSMLVSLREYAAEELDRHGETAATVARHRRFFADASRRWESTIGTDDETAAWAQIGLVRGDLLAASSNRPDESAGRGPDTSGGPDETLWLAAGVGWYWYTRGSLADAAPLIDTVRMAAAREDASADARAAALVAAGVVALGLGDLDAAEENLRQAGVVSAERDDQRRLAMVSAFRGHVARERGQPAQAAERYANARSIYQRAENARGTAWAAHDLGILADELNRPAEAESLLREALTAFRALGYAWAVAVSAAALASVLLRSGSAEEAEQLLSEAIALHVEVDDRRGIAQCLELVADVARLRGATATAAQLLGAALAQRDFAAARPTEAEQARVGRLANALARTLGQVAAEDGQRRGRALSLPAALALASAATENTANQTTAGGDRSLGGPAVLTPRQVQVAALVAAGNTNRQIGRALGISEKTTEIHLRNIMDRLRTPSRAGVAAWASTHGLQNP